MLFFMYNRNYWKLNTKQCLYKKDNTLILYKYTIKYIKKKKTISTHDV